MRLSALGATAALIVACVAGGAHAATTSVLHVTLPQSGDASVVVIRSGAKEAPLSLLLPSVGALGSGVVVATARRRLPTGWVAVVAIGRRVSDQPTTARTVVLAWRGGGRAMAQADVGAAARPARFCTTTRAFLEAAQLATWRRSSLGVGTAPRFAATALRAACSAPDVGARASLRRQLDPVTDETKPPPVAAGTPAPAVPPAQPPAAPLPAPPAPQPSPPPPAPTAPSLDLALSHRHATDASYVCLELATTAGARVVIRLTGPSNLTSITTIPSARSTETLAIEIYETGVYAVTATATKDGLVTQASGSLEVPAALGAGACGPGT